MGRIDYLSIQTKSGSGAYESAYGSAYETAYDDNGLLSPDQKAFLDSYNVSEEEVIAETSEEGKSHFATQLQLLIQRVNAGEGDTKEVGVETITSYEISDENGYLTFVVTNEAAYMNFDYNGESPIVVAPEKPVKKVFVPPPPYVMKKGDYVFKSNVLSGDDQLSYTVNRGRNEYGYILGIGSAGDYVLKLKQALKMAANVVWLTTPGNPTFTLTLTDEDLTNPKFDEKTLENFQNYQAVKKLKDTSGNVGPITLKALDSDANFSEVLNKINKASTQTPKTPSTASGGVWQFGQVGNKVYDMSTQEGRAGYANAMKDRHYSNPFGAYILDHAREIVAKANYVILKIDIKLQDPDTDEMTGFELYFKKEALINAIKQINGLMSSNDPSVVLASDMELETMQQTGSTGSGVPDIVLAGGVLVSSAVAEESGALLMDTEAGAEIMSGLEASTTVGETSTILGGELVVESGTVLGTEVVVETGAVMAGELALGALATGAAVVLIPLAFVALLFLAAGHRFKPTGLNILTDLTNALEILETETDVFVGPVTLPKPKSTNKPKDESKDKPKPKPKPKEEPKPPVVAPLNDDEEDCTPKPIGFHKGDIDNTWSPRYKSTKRSNEIADVEPPNVYPGQDVMLKKITFDAQGPDITFSPMGELWEVKAHNYSEYSDENKSRSIKNIQNSIKKQRDIAENCGFHYVVALTSEEEVAIIADMNPGLDVRYYPMEP
jgi:hypothetical protein